jgi:hypothetical protein
MARLSVGPSWSTLTDAQRQQVTESFGRYISAIYADRFDSNFRGLVIERHRLENYASSPPRGSGGRSACRDSTGQPSGDHSGNLQIVLFQHDHVRVAVDALITKAERGDLYPRLRKIFGRAVA